ncbi:hypothetical protein Taro_044694, partial [Colocasia esculenta]|nr:hypothetical protein [Colocasia esculenta]
MVWVFEVVEVLFQCGPASPSHCLTLRWFWSRVGRLGVGPQLGRAATPDCCFGNPFLGAIRGGTGVCSSLTSWSVRGTRWLYLCALDLLEVYAKGCFHIVFDFAGSAGVVFGPTLVVGRGVTLFHCFVVLYGVRCRTVVVAACSPCVASSVSCERERLYRELRVAFLQVLG